MNQKLLGALRGIGCLLFFAGATAVIGTIPDALTQVPVIGAFVTPAISGTLTVALLAGEHQLAVRWGYNLPPSSQS